MTVKEYLNQAYRLNELIKSNEAEIKQLRDRMESISAVDVSKEKVKSSAVSFDKMSDVLSKIANYESLIREENEKLIDIQQDIHNKIMLIQDNTQKIILKSRYINFLTWEQIAVNLGYTFQWVHILHKRALKNFEKVLNS